MHWLKHAFAVEPPGPAPPTDQQRAAVDLVLHTIVRRGMTVPARLALEVSRPLNHLAAQTMHFFAPVVTTLVGSDNYDQFTTFLERRGSIDYLCRRLEELDSPGTVPSQHNEPSSRAP